MKIAEILLSTSFGILGGLISGIIKDIFMAHISPYIKWDTDEKIKKRELKKNFIENLDIELNGSNIDFCRKLFKFRAITRKIKSEKLFTKKEINEADLRELEAIEEINKYCEPGLGDFIMPKNRPDESETTKKCFHFLHTVILRLKRKYNIR